MESLSRENEKVPAIGNMRVNAKGDQIRGGVVTKTADQIARENHRVQSVIVNTGLKGKQPVAPEIKLDTPKASTPPAPPAPKASIRPTSKKSKEKELPNGDIVVGDSNAG